MKLFSRMLSKKSEAEDSIGNLDLDMDVEPLQRRDSLKADDSGEINASQLSKTASLKGDAMSGPAGRELAPDPAPDPAPDAMGSAWGDQDWDDEDWDDDEDWGDDDDIEAAANGPTDDKEHLVDEIREAMGAVSHIQPEEAKVPAPERQKSELRNWAEDEEFGRRAIARSQLNTFGGGDAEDRILAETNSQMTDRETSRRRSAMAHLKAAAAATKADAVLKHVVGRDPSGDPEEQSPYRDDLAKVVRPRSTSRPISRPVSRPTSQSADWETDTADDASLFADNEDRDDNDTLEAELAAAEEERLARAPVDLSEDEFSDDTPVSGGFANSRFNAEPSAFENEPLGQAAAEEMPEVESAATPEPVQHDDLEDFEDSEDEQPAFGAINTSKPEPEPDPEPITEVAAPVSGRAGRGAGRVKTRLLGFQAGDTASQDIFAATAAKAAAMRDQKDEDLNAAAPAAPMLYTQFPTGWIVVIDGPGRGSCFTTYSGVSQIGRGEDQAVRLDFGDTSISRNNHAAIAYDDEQGKFFLGHGGKSNLVRLNGRPVLSTEELANDDEIRIGETTLKFVALCGENFVWNESEKGDAE